MTLPPSRTLAWRLLRNDADRTTQAPLKHVRDAEHHTLLARAGIDNNRTQNLNAWIARCCEVRTGPENPLKRFVIYLDHDQAAVHNTLTRPHCTGTPEGHGNRLKLLKRSAHGRAGFELLSKEVLHHLA